MTDDRCRGHVAGRRGQTAAASRKWRPGTPAADERRQALGRGGRAVHDGQSTPQRASASAAARAAPPAPRINAGSPARVSPATSTSAPRTPSTSVLYPCRPPSATTMVLTASASRASSETLVQMGDYRSLVRDGDVGAAKAEGRQALHRGAHVGRSHGERDVAIVQPERRERRVVHRRRQRMGDRVADDADDVRGAADRGAPLEGAGAGLCRPWLTLAVAAAAPRRPLRPLRGALTGPLASAFALSTRNCS